jgi:hypothetical protein
MSLTPLFAPLARRRPQPAVAQALAQEPVYDAAPKQPTDAKATAARIVEMGRVRRAETPDRTSVLTHPIARAIVAAAAKARAAPVGPPELPTHPVALAIVLSGRKARGEINPDGERWLTDYVRKFEARREFLR